MGLSFGQRRWALSYSDASSSVSAGRNQSSRFLPGEERHCLWAGKISVLHPSDAMDSKGHLNGAVPDVDRGELGSLRCKFNIVSQILWRLVCRKTQNKSNKALKY